MNEKEIKTLTELAEKVIQGDRRALARAITKIENSHIYTEFLIALFRKNIGKARRIGITGPPGAGKSTFVDKLIEHFRKQDRMVGITAVDPTSPFSGGAILGDRIRMTRHSSDEGVFIRSMASRGSLGGLANSAVDVADAFDAFGCDDILMETVGVGQSELDIVNVADTTIVVLLPEAGDGIQAMKAGLMEIADIFVVNKSDLAGADRTAREVGVMLEMRHDKSKEVPIFLTNSRADVGIDKVIEAVDEHWNFLSQNGELEKQRRKNLAARLWMIVEDRVKRHVHENDDLLDQFEELVDKVYKCFETPHNAAAEVISWHK